MRIGSLTLATTTSNAWLSMLASSMLHLSNLGLLNSKGWVNQTSFYMPHERELSNQAWKDCVGNQIQHPWYQEWISIWYQNPWYLINGRLSEHDESLYEPMISRMNWVISIEMLNHDIMNKVGSNSSGRINRRYS